MFKKLFGLVAALLFSAAAQAAFPPVSATHYNCGYAPGYHATVEAALAGWGGMGQPNVSGPYYYSAGSCIASINGNPAVISSGSLQTVNSCPANSALVGGECVCNSGYGENGSSCINEQCEVGKGRTFNRTEGWARSPDADEDSLIHKFTTPSVYDFNDGTCVGDIVKVEKCWLSQEPSAQGLYRLSCDYTMVVSGESSSPGDVNADPSTPPAACPGYVGQVNGKSMCVGNASNPLPSPQAAPNVPTGAGNPSSGEKPSSGPGSGSTGADRTPSTGSGGNDGGPASAANGRGGTGVRAENGRDGENGTAVCGAPPLPSCNVKIDEAGTPAEGTAEGRFGTARSGVDEQQGIIDGLFNTIETWTIGGWTWTFAFPTGCTPMTIDILGEIEVDPCKWQSHIHGLMSIIWVLTGICAAFVIFERGAA